MTNLNGTPEDLPSFPESPAAAAPAILGPWATAFWGLGALLLFGGAQLAGAFGYIYLFNQTHTGRRLTVGDVPTDGPLIATVMLVSTPFLVAMIALAVRRSRVPLKDYLALHWPRLRDYLIGLVGLAVVLVLASLMASLTGEQTPGFMTGTFESGRSAGMLPLLALGFVVAAPVGEEIFFRGFLYRGIEARFGVLPAVLSTALLWAILHIQYDAFFIVEIVTLGLFLGWVRWKSGSTLLTMALHATNNGLAMAALALGIQ